MKSIIIGKYTITGNQKVGDLDCVLIEHDFLDARLKDWNTDECMVALFNRVIELEDEIWDLKLREGVLSDEF